jgi:hypothetical protein
MSPEFMRLTITGLSVTSKLICCVQRGILDLKRLHRLLKPAQLLDDQGKRDLIVTLALSELHHAQAPLLQERIDRILDLFGNSA